MDEKQKNELVAKSYLDKITSSHIFATAPRYIELLTFLVEKALEGEHLKEYTIGVEFFKKRYKNETADSVVRVNMHNLRKKLTAYYHEEGQNDKVKFEFENRNYNLHINYKPVKNGWITKKTLLAACVGTFLIVITILILGLKPSHKDYFWRYFLDSQTPTICILADHLTLATKIDGEKVSMFHQRIITMQDIERSRKNVDTIAYAGFTFFTKSIPYAMQKLGGIYAKYDRDFTQVSESEFNLAESKNANIIYIGQPKLMGNSKYIFLQNSKRLGYNNYNYYVKDIDGEVVATYTDYHKRGYLYEYGVVSYMPINGGKRALFFTSNNDIGTMSVIDKFTDKEFLNELYKDFKSKDSYFHILYRVDGIGRVDLNFEIVYVEEIR